MQIHLLLDVIRDTEDLSSLAAHSASRSSATARRRGYGRRLAVHHYSAVFGLKETAHTEESSVDNNRCPCGKRTVRRKHLEHS